MKKRIFNFGIILILAVSFSSVLHAQYVEDALRDANYNGNITARAGGLGISYLGVADDYAALFYNPAGLSLVGRTEFTFGLGFDRNTVETNYQGTPTTTTSNNAYLNNIGFVFPFHMKSGSGSFALGYHMESNFSVNSGFTGFNTRNSMIADLAKFGTTDKNSNIPYQLFLSDTTKYTPLQNNLQQTGFVQAEGGLHNISAGFAFNITNYLSAGASLTYKFGKYTYNRTFTEEDVSNKYNGSNPLDSIIDYVDTGRVVHKFPVDLNKFSLLENVEQSVSGVTGSIGLQGRLKDFMRFGVAVKFPTYYTIDEVFGISGTSEFKTNHNVVYNGVPVSTNTFSYNPDKNTNTYHLTTPFVFSAGLSGHFYGVTLTGGFEYTDVTQTSFGADNYYYDSYYSMEDKTFYQGLNNQIAQQLTGQIRWGAGIEYTFPAMIPLALRASYSSLSSPYSTDISGADVKTYAFGAGVFIAPNVRVDGLFQMNSFSRQLTAYAAETYISSFKPWNIGAQLTVRF